MANVRLSQLKQALKAKRFIQFAHRFDDSPVRGYVMDIGPKFFLLAVVNDRIWFDGFECFRISDISKVRKDPYTSFTETALRKRSERRPKKPNVKVTSLEELLLSAGRTFPLVTIHRDQVDPDVCWIGRLLGVDDGLVSLLEINPGAKWHKKPTEYGLKEITRVSFGADYEDALHLVGGRRR